MSEEKVLKEKTKKTKNSKSVIASYIATALAAVMMTASALLIIKLTFMQVLPMKYTSRFQSKPSSDSTLQTVSS